MECSCSPVVEHCMAQWSASEKLSRWKKRNNSNGKNKNKDKSKIPLSLFLISECLEQVREMSRKGFDKVAGGG